MTNENNKNLDREDRNFYSEGQRPDSNNTQKTDSHNSDFNERTDGADKYESASAQNENTPDQENRNNSLQNDSDLDLNSTGSDNDPDRRTLDEYNATQQEPDQDNGLENVDGDNHSNSDSDPLDYDSYNNESEDDETTQNNLRDAFNDDDLK